VNKGATNRHFRFAPNPAADGKGKNLEIARAHRGWLALHEGFVRAKLAPR